MSRLLQSFSHYEDFAGALTFGWFGGAFLCTSMHKLAILADPISTFYNVGIVGLAKTARDHSATHQPT
jgi:hypothetical protein